MPTRRAPPKTPGPRGRRSPAGVRANVETLGVIELAPTEAAPVLRAYITMKPAGKYVRDYFDAGPDAPDAAFAAEAPRHPVFALHPRDYR